MKTLLVICARKGSKRLPGKHWKDVGGMPMWEYAYESCRDCLVGINRDRIVVSLSTDDPRMRRRFSSWAGWHLVRRPLRLCTDKASIHEVLQHAHESQEHWGPFDAVAFIPANVPTVTDALILKCIEKLRKDKTLTSVITVRTVRDLPEWMWVRGPEGELEPAFRQHSHAYRMQDIPARYVATGTVNVVRTEVLMACKDPAAFKWLGGRIGYVLDEDAIEVHDARDLELARAWMHWKREGKS